MCSPVSIFLVKKLNVNDLCVRQARDNQTQIAFRNHGLLDAGDVYAWIFWSEYDAGCVLTLKTTFTGFFEALSSTAYGLNFWHLNNFHFALLNKRNIGEQNL
jgi:hypothetical protein